MANAKKYDGGPAFPGSVEDPKYVVPDGQCLRHPVSGMTLRDWFAGKSLEGYRASARDEGPADIAVRAYEDADAMLAERRREENNDVGDR